MCERKDFLSNYCYIISIVGVVVWGYPSLVELSCGLRLSGETHLSRVCDILRSEVNTIHVCWKGSLINQLPALCY